MSKNGAQTSPNPSFNVNPSNTNNIANPNANTIQCQAFGSYYLADTANCASYYMCNNGKDTKMNCPEKQLYNAETNQCEDFQQVFCGTRAVNLAEKNQCTSEFTQSLIPTHQHLLYVDLLIF